MTDPTGARMRTMNAFFDSPRFAFLTIAPVDEPAPPVTVAPTTTMTTTETVTAAANSVAPPPPPKVLLFLPASGKRRVKTFLRDGLSFRVQGDKAISDAEVRLFEVLSGGERQLGVAFRVEPPASGAILKVAPTSYARSKLARGGKRTIRAVATATARDGSVAKVSATFDIT